MRREEQLYQWYKDGAAIACCRYIDRMTNEPLSECKECRDYVGKAQDDLEAWKQKGGD